MKRTRILFLVIAGITAYLQSTATVVIASSFGYNATDATTALRNALQANADTLVIDNQSTPWITGPQQIFNKTNYTIIIQPDVIIRARTGYGEFDQVLSFGFNNTNIKIIGYGATLQMLKSEYTTGEFRHCLQISGVNGFEVYGLTCKDSGGDGIIVAPGGNPLITPSRNVIIKDCVMDNNKRQGISVTAVENLVIDRCLMINTKGTPPAAGIDIEPFRPQHIFKNILVTNCTIRDNEGYGFEIVSGESQTLQNSVTVKNMLIENCARGGIRISDGFYGIEQGGPDLFLSNGVYQFSDCWVRNINGPALFITKPSDSLLTTFRNCIFENTNNNTTNPVFYGQTENTAFFPNSNIRIGPFYISSYLYPNTSNGNNTLAAQVKYGGVNFQNCVLVDDEPRAFLSSFGAATSQQVAYNQPLKDITGNILLVNTASSASTALYNNIPSFNQNVTVQKDQVNNYPASTVTLTASDNSAQEGTTDYGVFRFERNSNSLSYPLPVAYTVTGTATAFNDYSYLPGFSVIGSGNIFSTDTVWARQDGVVENNETVIADLSTLTNFYTNGSPANGTVVIGSIVLGLPAQLIDLKGVAKSSLSSFIEFTLSNERDASYYLLERLSVSGRVEKIFKIPVRSNAAAFNRYQQADSVLLSGTYIYRLTQYDIDGEYHILGQVAVRLGNTKSLQVIPNPASSNAIVVYGITTESQIKSLRLISADGKSIGIKVQAIGGNVIRIQPAAYITEGIYYLHIRTEKTDEILPVKIVK
jgi:hypothetical protein